MALSTPSLGLPFRTLISLPRIGSEICPDPPITTAGLWVFGTGVTHTLPGISIDSNASLPIIDTSDPVGLVEGRDYQVTIVVDTVTTAGTGFVATIGGTATPTITTTGTHVFEVTAGATGESSLDRVGAGTFVGAVSAFHIKPILWG